MVANILEQRLVPCTVLTGYDACYCMKQKLKGNKYYSFCLELSKTHRNNCLGHHSILASKSYCKFEVLSD